MNNILFILFYTLVLVGGVWAVIDMLPATFKRFILKHVFKYEEKSSEH